MDPAQLKLHISGLFARCLGIVEKKNADYSASDSNVFRNFEIVERMGVTDIKTGMLVRLSDKLARIANLLKKPPMVVEESLQDSIEDAINYLALLHARIESEKKKG